MDLKPEIREAIEVQIALAEDRIEQLNDMLRRQQDYLAELEAQLIPRVTGGAFLWAGGACASSPPPL